MATDDYSSHSVNGVIVHNFIGTIYSSCIHHSFNPLLGFSYTQPSPCFCNIPLDPISSWITPNLRTLLGSPDVTKYGYIYEHRRSTAGCFSYLRYKTSRTEPVDFFYLRDIGVSCVRGSYLSSIPRLGLGERGLACICSSTHGLLLFRDPISKYYIINPFIKQEYRGIFLQIPPQPHQPQDPAILTFNHVTHAYHIVCPVQPLRRVLLAYTPMGLLFNPRRGSQHQD